jgi:hypothetical protein
MQYPSFHRVTTETLVSLIVRFSIIASIYSFPTGIRFRNTQLLLPKQGYITTLHNPLLDNISPIGLLAIDLSIRTWENPSDAIQSSSPPIIRILGPFDQLDSISGGER